MPVCTGGSHPRPNVPATLVIDPRRTVATFTPGLEWINPFLPFLPTIVIDTPSFCSIDPPGDPGIDATDILDLLSPSTIGLAALAAIKIEQLLRNYAWYSLCMCTTGSTPAAPTAPSAPSDLPVLNPPQYYPVPSAGPCLERDSGLFDPVNFYVVHIPRFVIPTPLPIRLFYNIAALQHGSVHNTANWAFDFWNVAGSPLTTQAFGVSPAFGAVGEMVIQGGATEMSVRCAESGTGVGTDEWRCLLQFYCGGSSPATPDDPCCPPDPALMLAVQRMEALITLVQRQIVPFGYVPGASHLGVTGNGELSVTGLIGAKVTITDSRPGSIGERAADPTRLFGAGWIQWGSMDGFSERVYLDQEDTLSFPASAGAYTRLAYSLPSGVEVTIVELAREP